MNEDSDDYRASVGVFLGAMVLFAACLGVLYGWVALWLGLMIVVCGFMFGVACRLAAIEERDD